VPERLQKILAAAGLASRRAAEELLRQGRVSVNGRTARLGERADPAADRIELDGEPLPRPAPRYWLVNKPRGVLTTAADPEGRPTVLGLLPRDTGRLFPVGRLDRDTEGLVLLTNDGELAHVLLHPSLGNEREYRVTVRGAIPDGALERLRRGVRLEDGPTAPARVAAVERDPDADTSRFTLVLTEGRKRQIRRSLLALGHPVRRLVRTRMGTLRLGSLPRGGARPLSGEEVRALHEHARRLAEERRGSRRRGSRR